MSNREKGAWILSQSKSLDAVTGAHRFETISYAGKIGRLYNVLRQNVEGQNQSTLSPTEVEKLSQLNGIDLATRRAGLTVLKDDDRIDIAKNGAVSVFGATTKAVLETTARIFDETNHSKEEDAALSLSARIAEKPLSKSKAEKLIGDEFKLKDPGELIDLCIETSIVDSEKSKDVSILFNANVFRDKNRVRKAYFVLEGLSSSDRKSLEEASEILKKRGAVSEVEIKKILGERLFETFIAIGFFDRMEINNSSEIHGYLALPDAFQRYGSPFEEDPIDDAKALLASLTYGINRSSYARGQITMPEALLRALINGREVGRNKGGVRAIGEDYKALEGRGVVKVSEISKGRFAMRLLKKEVGELALSIHKGANAAEEAVLITTPAHSFDGPEANRRKSRRAIAEKKNVKDTKFTFDALDRLRAGE